MTSETNIDNLRKGMLPLLHKEGVQINNREMNNSVEMKHRT